MPLAAVTLVANPRFKYPKAHTFCWFWQTSTQRPQRIHLLASKTRAFVESSKGNRFVKLGNGASFIPKVLVKS